jgi:radical SAM superfamily enzyme
MLGLPDETHEMMMQTARQVATWNVQSVKIHNLYVVQRTAMIQQVESGQVRLLELDEYIALVADFIELLPPEMVIERISGDAPPNSLIAPQWCLQKGTIKQRLIETFTSRNSHQGSCYLLPD